MPKEFDLLYFLMSHSGFHITHAGLSAQSGSRNMVIYADPSKSLIASLVDPEKVLLRHIEVEYSGPACLAE
jgi:hypothetical protein